MTKAVKEPNRTDGNPLYRIMSVRIFIQGLPCQEWHQKQEILSLVKLPSKKSSALVLRSARAQSLKALCARVALIASGFEISIRAT